LETEYSWCIGKSKFAISNFQKRQGKNKIKKKQAFLRKIAF